VVNSSLCANAENHYIYAVMSKMHKLFGNMQDAKLVWVVFLSLPALYFNLGLLPLIGAVQMSQVLSVWMILIALNVETNLTAYLFVFLISSIVAVIPFTIGGIGARELTFLYASQLLGLDLPTSIALSMIFFLITAIVSLGGMVYLIRPERVHVPSMT
jgi:hypothetical protein